MADFKFGDLICYKTFDGLPHDDPLIYLGPCAHRTGLNARGEMTGLIDIHDCDPDGGYDPNHKDPSMWQRCTHLDE